MGTITAYGIIKYFNFIITAESEKLKKPDKEFFFRGVQKLKSKSETVFYIGDNLEKDAEGATNAGLCGVWLNRKDKIGSFDFTVKSLSEISLDEFHY